MDKITIVTAFFDIGRKDFKELPRSNDKYLEYFKFWARIKNDLVIYTDSVMGPKAMKVREEFGLKDKTKLVIIDDISTIDKELLERMQTIDGSKPFLNFRYNPNATENNGFYNYVMLLKAWCIKDASDKGVKGQIAWLDFGYNHGGKRFTDPLDFDFEWKYDFGNKITCFALKEDDGEPIFKKIQSLEPTIMGAPFIVPSKYANTLWELEKECMNELIDVGFTDDDQLIMLMAYRKNKDMFDIKISDWFMPIRDFGGTHLKYKELFQAKKNLLYRYRVIKRNRNYLKRFKSEFFKDYLD